MCLRIVSYTEIHRYTLMIKTKTWIFILLRNRIVSLYKIKFMEYSQNQKFGKRNNIKG